MGAGPSAARIRAVKALRGHLPVWLLESYRSAGHGIHQELNDANRLRRELLRARVTPRRFPPAAAGRLLSVWNAFVLQTVGEHLLDAVDPSADGVVSPAAADQILTLFGQADRWMSQARQAAIGLAYRVEERVHLPAEPPGWGGVELDHRLPPAAVVAASRAIYARGQAILSEYVQPLDTQHEDLHGLREMLNRAAGAIGYATRAADADVVPSPAVNVHLHLRYALRMLYAFGQFTAIPLLFDTHDQARVASLVAHVPTKIDPWCFTDPDQRTVLRSLRSAGEAIEKMWTADSSPMATIRVQAQIDAALRNGLIAFAADRTGERLGCFYRCPWPAIYEVRKPVTIGGTQMLPLQHFTYDVLGEEYRGGGPFARRIVVSVFAPSDARFSVE